ncbi:hypothetical protein [Halomicronema sp. CCY15110]|uniref:hypothetical protein n=1 Tax=Halomicronema sp. CCY15110 TaxID=2767773 RepID=UPI0019515FFB|nr:hypothetical protein [Halomicronema sp. CCY15110]
MEASLTSVAVEARNFKALIFCQILPVSPDIELYLDRSAGDSRPPSIERGRRLSNRQGGKTILIATNLNIR